MEKHLAGVELFDKALEIATKAHEGQCYGVNAPYIVHPVQVALFILIQGYPTEVIATGLLHDVVEDTGWTLDCLANENLPEAVIKGVDAATFTNADNPNNLTNEAKRNVKIEKAMSHPIGHVVKFFDSSSNFTETISHSMPADEFMKKSTKYATNVNRLLPTLPSVDDITRSIANCTFMIDEQLNNAVNRLASILQSSS
jgi:(p)ppGpp synthase/HD superfamily hydrolase